ncbi:hypothetical protein [Pelagibius sp. Alg239-R121]|uniref:hypothetical protein n=1 Tax=Pelagibius sp. Alg239-R121 TaxID=2993448 RepID=UPI0024A61BCB|nr:hypothetical protein [Pelagibius sp. Alg239-R121]
MSAFPASRPLLRPSGSVTAGSFLAAAALLVLGLGAGVPSVYAQQDAAPQKTGSPVRLTPPISLVPGQQPGAQPGAAKVPSAAAVKSLTVNQPAAQRKKGIEIDSLSAVDPNSIGAIDSESGGLGADLWRGSDRTTISGLLRRTPAGVSSPTLRDLLRRTLLSVADPPAARPTAAVPLAQLARSQETRNDAGLVARSAGIGGSAATVSSFLSLRAEALAALGESQGLNELLAVVPSRDVDEVITRVQVETLMLLQDDVTACAIVRDAVVSYPADPFWPKALMYCQIVAGDLNGAILGLDLLREGGDDDATFFELVESAEAAIGGATSDVTSLDPSPLHMSLARATNQRVLPDDVSTARPTVLAAIAASPAYNLPERAEAAEQAVAVGSFPASGLGELYSGFTFGNDELQAPIEAAAISNGVRGRALLFQAAGQQALPVARAEILNEAFRRMKDDGLAGVGNKVLMPLLIDIQPTRELLWFTETAGRALYMAGRTEQADAWATQAGRLVAVSPQAKGAALGLWPYQRLSGAGVTALGGTGEMGLAAWYPQRAEYLRDFVLAGQGEGADPDLPDGGDVAISSRQAILLRALLDAVGENDDLTWSDLALSTSWQAPEVEEGDDHGSVIATTDPVILLALGQASRANRKGESILLAAISAQNPAAAKHDLLAIATAVQSLRRLGFDREARALAMEAAEASGL